VKRKRQTRPAQAQTAGPSLESRMGIGLNTIALDHIATRIALKFGVSTEEAIKRLRSENRRSAN